jgi:hypothetical protein
MTLFVGFVKLHEISFEPRMREQIPMLIFGQVYFNEHIRVDLDL